MHCYGRKFSANLKYVERNKTSASGGSALQRHRQITFIRDANEQGKQRWPSRKKLHRSGPYADLFSQGVQVGNTLYLAGQVGMDDSGATPEDLLSQMKLAYHNIKAVLAEFGADMDNIVDETWFVTDVKDCMAQVEALFTERHMIYGKAPEVSQTLVQVGALVEPALKIEIKCVAALG